MRRALCVAILVLFVVAPVPASATTPPLMRYPKKTITIAPNATNGTTATCPSGTQVVGGGVSVSSSVMKLDVSASDSAVKWTGQATNLGPQARSLTVTADCITTSRLPVGTTIEVGLATGTVPPVAISTVTKDCPTSGRLAVGGGFQSSGFVTGSEPADGSDADGIPNDSWKLTIDNTGALSTATYAVEVFCIDPTVQVTPFEKTFDASTAAAHSVRCPKGTKVTGGGGDTSDPLRGSAPVKFGGRKPGTGWKLKTDAPAPAMNVWALCLGLN